MLQRLLFNIILCYLLVQNILFVGIIGILLAHRWAEFLIPKKSGQLTQIPIVND